VFLYAVRIWTLIPIVYALLALLNRLFAGLMGLSEARSCSAAASRPACLIAIAIALALYAYLRSSSGRLAGACQDTSGRDAPPAATCGCSSAWLSPFLACRTFHFLLSIPGGWDGIRLPTVTAWP
jgi:hypothetical protein